MHLLGALFPFYATRGFLFLFRRNEGYYLLHCVIQFRRNADTCSLFMQDDEEGLAALKSVVDMFIII